MITLPAVQGRIQILSKYTADPHISVPYLRADYQGSDTDYNAAREYFRQRFMKLNRSKTKEVYAAFTTAIDTNLLRVVMVSVQDTIIQRNLASINF